MVVQVSTKKTDVKSLIQLQSHMVPHSTTSDFNKIKSSTNSTPTTKKGTFFGVAAVQTAQTHGRTEIMF